MSFSKVEIAFEENRLIEVLSEIKEAQIAFEEALKVFNSDSKNINKAMWEETPNLRELDDMVSFLQYTNSLKQSTRSARDTRHMIKLLDKLLWSAYFARVDIIENGEEENIYIGLSGFSDKDKNILVYDWRSPIAGIYYDYDKGSAEYKSPMGNVKIDIVLKRQFYILRDKIQRMFDTDIKIDDAILQEALSKSTDGKMKTIVSTIQKDQNKAIREEGHKLLLVHGPAGCGKTSIAMHRIAYLLYRYNDKIKAENMLVFSPNAMFGDYISEVLPELGENNVPVTTYADAVSDAFPGRYECESYSDFNEYILKNKKSETNNSAAYKGSSEFLNVLEDRIYNMESYWNRFADIKSNDFFISKEELKELYSKDFSSLSIIARLNRINMRINKELEKYSKTLRKKIYDDADDMYEYLTDQERKAKARFFATEKLNPIRQKINSMCRVNIYKLYISILRRIDKNWALQVESNYRNRVVAYEDLGALSYLFIRVGVMKINSSIKQVIVDEVQDLSVIQLKVLFLLYKEAHFTMLGDINQIVNYRIHLGEMHDVIRLCESDSSIEVILNKTYRSTRQITEFSNKILNLSNKVIHMEREGEAVKELNCDSYSEILNNVLSEINIAEENEFKSVAIITRTAETAKRIYEDIKEKCSINIVSSSDSIFKSGKVIIPAYLAKGLEYDEVISLECNDDSYNLPQEERLVYTVCTRALHKLVLIKERQ